MSLHRLPRVKTGAVAKTEAVAVVDAVDAVAVDVEVAVVVHDRMKLQITVPMKLLPRTMLTELTAKQKEMAKLNNAGGAVEGETGDDGEEDVAAEGAGKIMVMESKRNKKCPQRVNQTRKNRTMEKLQRMVDVDGEGGGEVGADADGVETGVVVVAEGGVEMETLKVVARALMPRLKNDSERQLAWDVST